MKSRARLIVLLGTLPIVVFTLLGGFLGRAAVREGTYQHLRVFEDVVSLIANNYVEEVDLESAMQGALLGLSRSLDIDSAYLSAEEVKQMETGWKQPEGELGLEIASGFYIRVIAARDESPASNAGLLPGDYIRTIDNQTTRGMSAIKGLRLLRGEPGSIVQLSLLRGQNPEPYDIQLIRTNTDDANLTTRMLANDIGYIRIINFTVGISNELMEAQFELKELGATRLVVDIRSTAGGSYEEGIAAAKLFVESGTLLKRAEYDNEPIAIEATAGKMAINTPLVILINNGTAHAAELFVAGLSNHGRADTVGQKTAGFASQQKLVKLPDGTGLWIPWAWYLHDSGELIHGAGIEPTLSVELPAVELGESLPTVDLILERALEHLHAGVISRDRRVAQLVRAPA